MPDGIPIDDGSGATSPGAIAVGGTLSPGGTETGTGSLSGSLGPILNGFFGGSGDDGLSDAQRAFEQNKDPRISKIGSNTSGNPVYQIIDEIGQVIQFVIDPTGTATDYANVTPQNNAVNLLPGNPAAPGAVLPAAVGGPSLFTAPPTVAPAVGNAPTVATSPAAGLVSGLVPSVSNLLGGVNPGDNNSFVPSGLTISPSTVNAPVTSLFTDNSNRSVTTLNTTTSVNDTAIFNKMADTFKSLWGSVQNAANATPSNDAANTYGTRYPGMFSAGQTLLPGGGGASPSGIGAATIKGFDFPKLIQDNKALVYIGIVLAILTGLLLFKRK